MSDWSELFQPWALTLLGTPWLAAALVELVPSARYRRDVRHAQEMAAAMPPGPLRDAWQSEATRAGILLLTRVRGRRRTRFLSVAVYVVMPLVLSLVIAVWILDGADKRGATETTIIGVLVLTTLWLVEGGAYRRAVRTNRRERELLLQFHGIANDDEMVFRELWNRLGLPTPEQAVEQDEERARRRQERKQRRQQAREQKRRPTRGKRD